MGDQSSKQSEVTQLGHLIAENPPEVSKGKIRKFSQYSPASMRIGPWGRICYFVPWGVGFHPQALKATAYNPRGQ